MLLTLPLVIMVVKILMTVEIFSVELMKIMMVVVVLKMMLMMVVAMMVAELMLMIFLWERSLSAYGQCTISSGGRNHCSLG